MGSATHTLVGGPGGSVVNLVQVCLGVQHPRQSDLVIRLTHAGITATLTSHPGTEDGQSGYTAANLGALIGGGFEQFSFSDSAAMPYAVPPIGNTPRPGINGVHGEFKPTIDPLSVFIGAPLPGNWVLEVADDAPGLSGVFSMFTITINPGGPCYVNCDASSTSPRLTANDFQCFLNRFAAQDPYANCDGSTGSPLLTANDFQCFINLYAAGCP